MQRYSPFLTSLLFHYVFSVWCFPEEAVYGDGIFDLGGIEPLFDDSDPNFQPLLDSTPALISARAEEFCSSLDITPNMKVRVRETACPADPQDPSTALDIPILDIFQDANYLCPFDMKIGLRVLVCGKPVSVDGLTPDALIDVKDARLYPRLPEIKCVWPDFVFCCEQINELVDSLVKFTERIVLEAERDYKEVIFAYD